jgi:two-component system NtrC family sensor kinase
VFQLISGRPNIATRLLLWFLVIALLPFTVVTYLIYITTVNTLTTEFQRSIVAVADSKTEQIEVYATETKNDVTALAQRPSLKEAMSQVDQMSTQGGPVTPAYDEIERQFRYLFAPLINVQYHNLILISAAGNVVFTMRQGKELGANLRSGPYRDSELGQVFARVKTSLKTETSDFKRYPFTGAPAMFIAAPIVEGGRLLGVLAVQLSDAEVYKFISAYGGLGQTGELIIAVRDGNDALVVVPLRHDPDAAFKERIPLGSEQSIATQKAVLGQNGAGIVIDRRGEETIAAWRYLPTFRWGMVVKVDTAEAFAPIVQQRNGVIGLGGITLVLIGLATVVVTRSISNPIVNLTHSVTSIAEGNLDQQVPVTTKDELGQLGHAFNQMTISLKTSYEKQERYGHNLEQKIIEQQQTERELQQARDELQKVNDYLERRVEERTTELKQIAAENIQLYETQREQYRRLRESQAQLIQVEKMAALGRLVASVIHEINNPLQAVQGFLNLLKEELEGQCRREDMHESLSIVESEMERIGAMMNRLRDFYRLTQPTQPASVDSFYQPAGQELPFIDLHAVLESVLQLTHQKIEQARIKVERAWAENLPPIQANADHLKQVFLNLTLNALEAMPNKGETLRVATIPDLIQLNGGPPQPLVRIEFSDTGAGMPPEALSHLFEPLFTTKESGSGFGLFTSYKIIEAHHGQISVTSQVGQGTTFTILLPVRQPCDNPKEVKPATNFTN